MYDGSGVMLLVTWNKLLLLDYLGYWFVSFIGLQLTLRIDLVWSLVTGFKMSVHALRLEINGNQWRIVERSLLASLGLSASLGQRDTVQFIW